MAERPFTPEMLAERWRCSAAHIRRLCQRGGLPHFRVGKEYRIPLRVIEDIKRGDRLGRYTKPDREAAAAPLIPRQIPQQETLL